MKRFLTTCGLSLLALPLFAQTALSDMGTTTYQGYQGGLYPNGSNDPPAAHRNAAINAANKVKPLDGAGASNARGAIGVIGIGMSNTTQEFRALERNEDLSASRRGPVVFVNGAKSAVTAERWSNAADPIWGELDARIASAGLTASQVQVAWIKLAHAEPATGFPLHAQALRDDVAEVVRIAKSRFPKLQLAFLSNRIYGGYTTRQDRGEPLSFEVGFAVKWLIEQQIAGDLSLNYDARRGPVNAPVMLWAKDLWANGATPRSDGLSWLPEDYEPDFIHPSAEGEQIVANLWSSAMAASPAIKPWYQEKGSAPTVVALTPEADAYVSAGQPGANFGAQSVLRVRGGSQPLRGYLRFQLPQFDRPVVRAHLTGYTVDGLAAQVFRAGADFNESTITYNNAPASTGSASAPTSQASNASSWRIDVTSLVNQVGAGPLVLMLSSASGSAQSVASREGLGGPLLVVTLEDAAP